MKTSWPDEIPRILWAYHNTPQSTTQETPFNLVYGTDALLPIEFGDTTERPITNQEEEEQNIHTNLDVLEEVRELARITSQVTKRQVERRYKTKVRPRDVKESDLVLRKAHIIEIEDKLSPKWVSQFRVKKALLGGAYKLKTLDGTTIPRTWNAANLQFYLS